MWTYLISVAVILGLMGLIWYIVRAVSARRTRLGRDYLLEDIAAAARLSLRDMSTGRDWEDAVVRCYENMTEVVARRRGHQRDPYLTPSEFAARLEQSGLPSQAVRRLTRLFESVRYGARTSGAHESVEAEDCLREVLLYCGEPV